MIRIMMERLRRLAREDHPQPQYQGYFDAWVLAEAKNNNVIAYKGGSQLIKGRWVLASPDLRQWYDPDNGFICAVDAGNLREVMSNEQRTLQMGSGI